MECHPKRHSAEENNCYGSGTSQNPKIFIEKTDITILPMTTGHEFQMMSRVIGSIPLEDATVIGVGNDNNDDIRVPRQLLGAGEHFDDMPRDIQENRRRSYNEV